jgi:hypothetical protein
MLFRNNCNRILVCEMLDRIPQDEWVSDTSTFLDPAMASGQFVTEIERRLRAMGHSNENIRSRVFGLETSRMQVNIAVNMNELAGTYAADANYQSFLSGRAPSLPKGWPVQFDNIVGNPPYQADNGISSKLWVRFVIASDAVLRDGGHMLMVVPNSWSKPLSPKPNSANKRLNDILFGNTLVAYDLDVSRYFSVGVVPSTFHIIKDGAETETKFLVTKHQSLATKFLASPEDRFVCGDETPWRRLPTLPEATAKAQVPIRMKKSIGYSTFDDPVRFAPKIIFPRELGYYVFQDELGKFGFNNQSRALLLSSKEEVKSAFSFFDSSVVRWIVRNFSWTPQTDFILLSMIRLPKFDRVFTEAEIYKHFKLTGAEVNIVKATLK